MNSFLRFALAAATLMARADAAAFTTSEVVCLEELDEICTGFSFFTTPSPGTLCVDPDDETTCETIYEGGYSWTYSFVEGYEEGTDLGEEDPEDVAAAETGLEVSVTMDDSLSTCEITVGNETCTSCSIAACTGFNVTYDCLNVDMGSMSMECVAVEPIFYPLELEDGNVTTLPGSPTTDDEPAPESFAGENSASSSLSVIASAVLMMASGFFAL
jgi:hypothetical protein